jgi:phage shock protein PspC (stress-responsive transcriptional regulator)
MNCNDAVAALVASMESGGTLSEEQREHIRSCDRCRELLDSAKQFQSLLGENGLHAPKTDATIAAAEEEVFRKRYWYTLRAVAAVFLLFVGVVATGVIRLGNAQPGRILLIAAAVYTVWMGIIALVLFLFSYVLRTTRAGRPRFYKRLGPGRMLSGVCLGIAEVTNVDVRLLRLLFVVLFFFDGAGFLLYLLLDLAMPVHPDDRQHLLRFRMRRWWQRRFGNAEHHAG